MRLRGQRFNRQYAGFTLGSRRRVSRGEVAQQREATLANDPLGGLRDDAVHAADGARFDTDGIVRNVEVGFLWKSAPFQLKQQVARPECFAGSYDVGQQSVQLTVPDLVPRLPSRKAERLRMLEAEHGPVGVVVQDGELRPPEQADLRPGRQQHADGAPQTLRPRFGAT